MAIVDTTGVWSLRERHLWLLVGDALALEFKTYLFAKAYPI